MSDFWKSYDITAAEYGAGYECYPLFGTVHLIELALSALFLLGMVWWYRRSTPRTRRHILVGVTAALLADEAALLLGMACTGQWNWSYLPLHLCSINVFVCLYNTLTDRSWCKEELYALCIPGAALALLCTALCLCRRRQGFAGLHHWSGCHGRQQLRCGSHHQSERQTQCPARAAYAGRLHL